MKKKIPKAKIDEILIKAPGKGKAIKLCNDGIHYEIVKKAK